LHLSLDLSKAVVEFKDNPFTENYVKKFYYQEMNEISLNMFSHVIESFEEKNTSLARHIFMMDKDLNKFYKKALSNFHLEIKENTNRPEELLMFYSICSRIVRTGGLLTNIAEEIIFYLEAEVLKHQKMKAKMKEKKD
jgi:phosphate transport system protein